MLNGFWLLLPKKFVEPFDAGENVFVEDGWLKP